jgi:hypothetical protein
MDARRGSDSYAGRFSLFEEPRCRDCIITAEGGKMDSLENKKLGDIVWILDYSNANAKCGLLVEHRFILWENRNVLTMHDSRLFIHDEDKIFSSPTLAAKEIERNHRLDAELKNSLRQSAKRNRKDLDTRLKPKNTSDCEE